MNTKTAVLYFRPCTAPSTSEMDSMVVDLFGILILFETVAIRGTELVWDEAFSQCKQESKIIKAKNVSTDFYTSDQSWTPNYLLHFSCVDNFALYVEQLPKADKHKGLCRDIKMRNTVVALNTPLNYTNADFTCKWDHRPSGIYPNSLLHITSSSVLREAINVMDMHHKYWISGVNFNFCPVHRLCEKVKQLSSNHSKMKTFTDCDEKHAFICEAESRYRTAVSLVRVIPDSFKDNGKTDSSDVVWKVAIVVLSVLFLLGIGIAGFIYRKVVVGIKRELDHLREQGYHQSMYNADQIQMIRNEPEPDTPISPSGTSFYENFMNTGPNPEEDIRVSYRTTTQVEATVEVRGHKGQRTSRIHGNGVPFLGFQGLRTPPRGRGMKHKSFSNYYNGNIRLLDCRQTSTEPAAARRFPLEYFRGMPEEWFKAQDEPLYTQPHKPKPGIRCITSDDENNVYIGPDSAHYLNTCTHCERENPNCVDPEDYENIWQET